ncbi:MAG: heme-binding protein [Deltaproteobacteria bacterium]|nr:heme-binding protein [Deltaproteobacteria bacterium]
MAMHRQGFMGFIVLVLSFILCTGERGMAVEKATYTVIVKSGDFELRQYPPQIVAQTVVEGDFDEVGNIGFRRLFGYISGKNTRKQPIPMTAPVSQEALSEKIPMTAPVNQEKAGDKWHVSFLMPSAYTLETLPVPVDDQVVLRQIPGRLMAAVTYSGTWSRKRYEEQKSRLEEWVGESKLKPVSEYIYARYNPPFMPWFLRRNEVLVPVELDQE